MRKAKVFVLILFSSLFMLFTSTNIFASSSLINKEYKSINVYEKFDIKTIQNDSSKKYNYSSSDNAVASVNSDGIIACQMDLKFNKKAKQMEGISQRYYGKMCFFDYHSRLVSMDKPVDPKKVIHSNNYLSFWVKQESLGNGKLNQEAIDRYFDVLKNPEKKFILPDLYFSDKSDT